MKRRIRLNERQLHSLIGKAVRRVIRETAEQNNYDWSNKESNYTHFAVDKVTGEIVNGWDYSEYSNSEVMDSKKDYFYYDLEDMDMNPKNYVIRNKAFLQRNGILPGKPEKTSLTYRGCLIKFNDETKLWDVHFGKSSYDYEDSVPSIENAKIAIDRFKELKDDDDIEYSDLFFGLN
ncbi:MAG: hypothetical protein M0R03_19895 [Novosphingobium sp.]|nr:hypothetical protein [Novosphingobium sp.]